MVWLGNVHSPITDSRITTARWAAACAMLAV
jgi:hypothetical protein